LVLFTIIAIEPNLTAYINDKSPIVNTFSSTYFKTPPDKTKENGEPTISLPYIEVWGTQTLVADINRVRFPGVTLADNGDLVVTYCRGDTIDYSCWMQVWCMISHDNGSTWDSPYMIQEFDSYVGEISWTLITAPNGDLLFMFCDDQEWVEHNGTDIWRNTNNGQQGYWSYSGNFSEFGQCFVYDWYVFNNTIYAFMNNPHIFEGCTSKIVYSIDNGHTWTQLGNNIGSFGGEWCALPLNENAFHWKTVNRFTKNDNGPNGNSSCDSQGPGLPYAPWLEQYETIDGGQSWKGCNSNCPDECSDAVQESNVPNKGPCLWWLDNRIIIANIESYDTPNAYATIWVNYDKMSNSAWSNHITLGPEGVSPPRNAYSRGCALPKREGDIGGWGFVVWSEQSNTYIKGAWVANNNSLIWDWPPGPYGKMSNLNCNGDLRWINVNPGERIKDCFAVKNIGDSGSELNWKIVEWPKSWGNWTLSPSSGYNLTPEDGLVTVEVEVVAPSEQNQQFSGDIKLVNKDNSFDFCTISVFLSTPRDKMMSSSLFLRFLEQFPILQKILLFQR
jgi:hypothetical protein